jgi:hypothetical protein
MNAVRPIKYDTHSISTVKKDDKPFRELRADMIKFGYDNEMLGKEIGRTSQHVSRCINGHAYFNQKEQYIILELFDRPASDLNIVFPKNGYAPLPTIYRFKSNR